jgi:hypothetical protein
MFGASDTEHAPWYVAQADRKRNVRLNIMHHLLSKVPYEELPREKIVLPKRQRRGDYVESDHPLRKVPEVY